MKKRVLLVFTAFAGALFFSGCNRDENIIKVGILHSETGTMAMSEKPLIQAELLAIEEINEAGGLLGKKIVPLIEDGQSDPDVFAEKAKKLLATDKVSTIFGCWTSAARKAVKPVVEEDFALLWYPLQYEGMESSPNIMYMGTTPNQQIVPAVEYCVNHFGKNVYLIGSDYIFPHTANKIIKAQLKSLGANVVQESYKSLGCTNCLPSVEEILEKKPDFILNTLNGSTNISFFKLLHEKGISAEQIPVLSFSVSESEVEEIGVENIAGHYLAWNYFSSVESPANLDFIRRYRKKYGETKMIGAPLEAAYSAVYMWAMAVEKAGTTDVEEVRMASKGLEFDAPGGRILIDGSNQHTYKRTRIGKIKEDGIIEEVWESDDDVRPDPYLSAYSWARGL